MTENRLPTRNVPPISGLTPKQPFEMQADVQRDKSVARNTATYNSTAPASDAGVKNILAELLVASGRINNMDERTLLCEEIGVDSKRSKFFDDPDSTFAEMLVRYLYNRGGSLTALIPLCNALTKYLTDINAKKLEWIQDNLTGLEQEQNRTINDRSNGPKPKQKNGEEIPTELSSEEILNDLLNYEGRIKNAVAGYFYCLERRASLKIVIERLGKIIEDPKLVEQPDFWKSIEPEIEENLKVKQSIEDCPESPPAMKDFNSELGDAINTYTTIRNAWRYHPWRPAISDTRDSLLRVAEAMEGLQKKAIELKDHYLSRSMKLLGETEAIISRIGEFLKKAESQSNKEVLNKLVFSQSQSPPMQTRFKDN